MPKPKQYILSTRPLAKEIISEAEKDNIIIEELSFIETKPIHDPQLFERIKDLSTQKLTVAFTSMNAVEAVVPHVDKVGWRIYCLGNTTKKLVEENFGGDNIAATADNAKFLAERMIDDGVKSIVFFCGNIRRDDLINKFRSEKAQVEEVIVYETMETPAVFTKEYDAILFFSPSAVHSFFKANKLNRQTQVFAIGKTTSETIRQYKHHKIIVANATDKNELARQAIAYLANKIIN